MQVEKLEVEVLLFKNISDWRRLRFSEFLKKQIPNKHLEILFIYLRWKFIINYIRISMEELENKEQGSAREEIFSRAVRAGKRTYFFDVKATKSDEQYLTITESKRRFSNDQGKFLYEKHKLFLYKEDFEKFATGLNAAIEFIETGIAPPEPEPTVFQDKTNNHLTDLEFENLGTTGKDEL
jgi:hypothetical protein